MLGLIDFDINHYLLLFNNVWTNTNGCILVNLLIHSKINQLSDCYLLNWILTAWNKGLIKGSNNFNEIVCPIKLLRSLLLGAINNGKRYLPPPLGVAERGSGE